MDQLKFNDLTREYMEDFIKKLPKDEKKKLKAYIEDHPRNSSAGMFAMIKSYIYNTYIRQNNSSNFKNKNTTFVDTIEEILMEDDLDE